MTYLENLKQENQSVKERYELAIEKMNRVILGELEVEETYRDYFLKLANMLLLIDKVAKLSNIDSFECNKDERFCLNNLPITKCSMEELEALNRELYKDIKVDSYETSYGNPSYSVQQFGLELGQMLSYLYAELQSGISFAFSAHYFNIVIRMELLLEIYGMFLDAAEEGKLPEFAALKETFFWFASSRGTAA